MGSKKNFVLRIDEDTFKALERWSGDEFRSVNGQLEWIIDKALKDAGRKKKDQNENENNKDKQE